jgi:hypothetical protein
MDSLASSSSADHVRQFEHGCTPIRHQISRSGPVEMQGFIDRGIVIQAHFEEFDLTVVMTSEENGPLPGMATGTCRTVC